MLARRVLWDEDLGLGADSIAAAVHASPDAVRAALTELEGEGWVEVDYQTWTPALTAAGMSALLGRQRP